MKSGPLESLYLLFDTGSPLSRSPLVKGILPKSLSVTAGPGGEILQKRGEGIYSRTLANRPKDQQNEVSQENCILISPNLKHYCIIYQGHPHHHHTHAFCITQCSSSSGPAISSLYRQGNRLREAESLVHRPPPHLL